MECRAASISNGRVRGGCMPDLSEQNIQKHTERARELTGRMSLRDKVWMMTSATPVLRVAFDFFIRRHYNSKPYLAGGNRRFGIPRIAFADGPRGLVCSKATCFPVSMARGAAFDTALEERIGEAVGRELRAVGGNYYGGVCINVPRHPAWGRSQETYGEDPFLLGEFGAALTRGVQRHNVMACVKHYALNSMENARFKVDVRCSERTLREVYLPAFRKCIDAGAASIMGAYNKFRGEHCCHNAYLLKKVLRDDWNFYGFTLSDFVWGIRDTKAAADGGMEVEMPFHRFYGKRLLRAVQRGEVEERIIDEAVCHIAGTVLLFTEAEDPEEEYSRRLLACPEHVALAVEAAEKAMTLVKNDGSLLPLDKKQIRKLAVLGKLADQPNIGDHGSSMVHPPYTVSPLQGFKNLLGPSVEITQHDGKLLGPAVEAAKRADAVVIVAGYDYFDEGEYMKEQILAGGDRDSLSLHDNEIELINAAAEVNRNCIVVLIGGNTIIMEEWKENIPAVLFAYYPGMEGGNVIARTLFGEVNPGGKLPFVIPADSSHLPPFDKDAAKAEYGYYHGYTKLDKEGIEPAYHFGHGLSYTVFEQKDPKFEVAHGVISASCLVTNTGGRDGDQVIQFYAGFEKSKIDRPVKLLRGFRRVSLGPGESRRVEIHCPVRELAWYNPESGSWELEDIKYSGYIGPSSNPEELLRGKFIL